MSHRAMILAVALLLSVAVNQRAQGRIRQLWTQQQMVDKSDLIAMAKVVEVRDTGVATTIPNISRGTDPIAAVEMEATFEVSAVLKGKHEGPRLVFCYLREVKHEVALRGEPELVGFEAGEKQYLLFLKREADGRYSAVIGQTDPADAVREVGRAARVEVKGGEKP